ncbi:hypothetical protein K370107A2_15770 [Merdimmobilis hominis]|uniref:ERCC4 domain-containing protein n=1 Tax=Merdimmobilis hominis TaxID=2897707 RepID=UPI0032D54FA3
MMRVYSEKETAAILKAMEVQVDTREQVWGHVEKSLGEMGVKAQQKALPQGDYTALVPLSAFGPEYEGLPGYQSLQDEVVVERKANLDEIAGNFTADRRRFEGEFQRAKARGVKVFLLIENASWQDVWSHNYRSRLSPKALAGSLLSWQAKYGVTLLFCRPEESGKLICGILHYWLRAKLEGEL